MGCNYYVKIKCNYDENTCSQLGVDLRKYEVYELTNGLVWNNTYYKNKEDLNKDFYQFIHVGKSSLGWHFSLCIYPKYEVLGKDLKTFSDWVKLFDNPLVTIYSEEDSIISKEDMIRIISDREHKFDNEVTQDEFERIQVNMQNEFSQKFGGRQYISYEQLLEENHAERGLYGLWRHKEDEYTFHTEGTYDYIVSGKDAYEGIMFS